MKTIALVGSHHHGEPFCVFRVSRGWGEKSIEERAREEAFPSMPPPRLRERAKKDRKGRPWGGGRCVLMHRHYKGWQGLVAVARDRIAALQYCTEIDVHAVVHGTPASASFELQGDLDGAPTTRSACVVLKSSSSNASGSVSLLRIRTPCCVGERQDMKKYQIRRLLATAGHPVVGNGGGAVALKGVKLGMAVTRVSIRRKGDPMEKAVVCSTDVPSHLFAILRTEERFYTERARKRASELGKDPLALFCGHVFYFSKNVLRPRRGTETVVGRAAELHLNRGRGEPKILDLGTGTGCILISLLLRLEYASGIGVDISSAALHIARSNASKHGLWSCCAVVEGAFDALPANVVNESFNIM